MSNSSLPRLRETRQRASHEAQHWLERFLAQAAFAEALCRLHKRRAPAWRKLLARASQQVDAALGKGVAPLTSAVAAAEQTLSPIATVAKSYTIYCVGHAHIDMNWMWSWPETVATTHDTFGTVLRLMDEYPEFHYSQSQASVYAIVERHNPEMLRRIRARVRQGRWEVTASHWVEGDKNLVSGEALCRHLLYTRRYMQRLFGLTPEDIVIDWSPDTFGHAATIPSYLVRGGVRRYYCCRPGDAATRPVAFRWRAPDRSEVLVFRDPTWYNGKATPEMTSALVAFCEATGLRSWMHVYGIGDHGGGPTRRDIERILDMDAWPVFPNVTMSSTRPFYEELEKARAKLPVLQEELNFEFTGCYTSQSLIKKDNRFAESQLCDAEVAAALAWAALGRPYPGDALREAWQKTLFSHFHDILPGSGVHDTRTYTHGLFQEIAAASGMAETEALRALAGRVDTAFGGSDKEPPGPASFVRSAIGAGVGFGSVSGQVSAAEQTAGQGARPFVVFNTLAHQRSGVATVTVWDNAPEGARKITDIPFSVLTPSGKTVPAQRVADGHYWGHDYVTLAFPVEPVPGFGYAAYVVREQESPAGRPLARMGKHLVLENDRIRAEIDAADGTIRRLVDRESGTRVIDPRRHAGVLEFGIERPHGMSAWRLDEMGPKKLPTVKTFGLAANGPHLARADVGLRLGRSEFTLRYELRANDPNLYITLDGTWFERGTPRKGVPNLSIAFPLALQKAAGRYEVPFGAIDRKRNNGEEVPALRWAQISGIAGTKPAGCLLVNDSKHGHSLEGSTLRLTLIRSSYEPDPLPEIGHHTVRLALSPFAGKLPVADAIRRGATLNQPLRAIGTDVHEGPLPRTGRFLSVGPDNVVLSSLKKAEDRDGLIVRIFETRGRKTTARIRVDRKLLGTLRSAAAVDVLERPVTKSGLKRTGNSVSVPVPARGMATVLLELRP